MMRIGFSSLTCPEWDWETIVTNASAMGYDGVELCGLHGQMHLPLVSELAGQSDRVRKLFADNNVELVCLGTSANLASYDRSEVERQKTVITESIELAAGLGCPNVCLHAGEMQGVDNQRTALSRIAEALIALVPVASEHNVTLLVENGGDFAGSADMWFIVDAVSHPAVRCCWNQCHAMSILEQATNSIPRLATKIGLVHLCDGTFDERGALLEYKPLGIGDVQIARQIELLKGLLYDGYLVFERPTPSAGSLPAPRDALESAAKFLRECIEEQQSILSAYKADKQAPKLATRVTDSIIR